MRSFLTRPAIVGLSALALLTTLGGSIQAVRRTAAAAADPIFPKGERAPAANFTGTVWVRSLVPDDNTYHCVMGNVTFEPGARSNWHRHAAGQILLVTDGIGYYQERGQPKQLLHKGDVIKSLPGVEHWHGASAKQAMTHIATVPNTQKGVAVWLQPVTAQEYAASPN